METHHVAAITQTVNLYALALDSLNIDLFDRIFTPDCVADYGGPKPFEGLEPFKARFAETHRGFDATQHFVTNHHVTIAGNDATCLSYFRAMLMRDMPGGDNLFETAGWYDDRLTLTPDGWRIAHRVCRQTWSGGNPQIPPMAPGTPAVLSREAANQSVGHIAALLSG
ncbi:MAG: nuclear transport factor 2 family protein [Novosphingobium sp.]|nr:nuclear transport factor 2 family protein [Novosphingobium sp.]